MHVQTVEPLQSFLIPGEWYLLQTTEMIQCMGRFVETKGDDERFPTFLIPLPYTTAMRISVRRERVIGWVQVIT